MRIAYTAFIPDVRRPSGIAKKIVDQTAAWREQGHEVRLFVLSNSPPGESILPSDYSDIVFGLRPSTLLAKGRIQSRQVVEWGPDLAYARYDFYYRAFDSVFSRCPVVAEVNTDDRRERALKARRSLLGPLRWLYTSLTRRRFLEQLSGVVFVSNEIAERMAVAGIPSIVCGNPIDLERIRQLPPAANPHPQLVFVGTAQQPWHGIEKLLQLADAFPEWTVHLIGSEAGDLPGTPPPNLIAHGFLTRSEYEPIMESSDAAIGTLSLYRNGMSEASPLKVREYLASGLPTIIGYSDTDFPVPPDFLLQLENSPDNVAANLHRIETFVQGWRGRRVPRSEIEHLDTGAKQALILDFLEQVRQGHPQKAS